jgi:hypothetical protein
MSIFGSEGDVGFGSLGMGAPDTGRGNAFDRQARRRGYGISPQLGQTPIDFDEPRGVPIPPGAFYGGVEFGTPPPQRIPPGDIYGGLEFGTPRHSQLPARQGVFGGGVAGMGAVSRSRTIPRMAKGQLTLTNTFSVPLEVAVLNAAGSVVTSAMIPPRNQVTLALTAGTYSVRYTATFRAGTSGGTAIVIGGGTTISRSLAAY